MANIFYDQMWSHGSAPKITGGEFLKICGQAATPMYGDGKLYDKDWPAEYLIILNFPIPFPEVFYVMLSFSKDSAPKILFSPFLVVDRSKVTAEDAMMGAAYFGDKDVVLRKVNFDGVKQWLLEHENEFAQERFQRIPLDPLDSLGDIFHVTFGRNPELKFME